MSHGQAFVDKSLQFLTQMALLTCWFNAIAFGQTTIVAVRTQRQVILAADSKITTSSKPFCKIKPCGNAFLAVSGLYEALTVEHERFEAWPKLLETCSKDITPNEQMKRLEDAGIRWLNERLDFGYRHSKNQNEYDRVRLRAQLQILIVGWGSTHPYILARHIGNRPQSLTFSVAKAVTEKKAIDYDYALKPTHFIDHFLGHYDALPAPSDRALAYRRLGFPQAAESFVTTMIAHRPNDVGPPVDIVMINRRGFRWIKRKSECGRD